MQLMQLTGPNSSIFNPIRIKFQTVQLYTQEAIQKLQHDISATWLSLRK